MKRKRARDVNIRDALAAGRVATAREFLHGMLKHRFRQSKAALKVDNRHRDGPGRSSLVIVPLKEKLWGYCLGRATARHVRMS